MTDQQLQSLRNLGNEAEEAADLICSQAAEIAALRADAERYRWLRERTSVSSAGTHNHEPAAFMVMPAWRVDRVGMSLDAAIDAARQS